jgi:cytochrome P450
MGLYGPGHEVKDPTVSAICRNRAGVLRRYNWPTIDIAASETMLAAAATLNTVPTMFWILYHLLHRPDLIANLRRELEPYLKRDDDGVILVDVNVLDKECPLLLSCYRESMRVENAVVSMRRVMEDTLISDGHGGSYLLKKGTDVQIAGSALRAMEGIWGPDAKDFNPERFMPETEKGYTIEEARARKAAYFPFGGGKHLCPGRMFAYAEVLATTCMLAVGFEFRPLKGNKFATVETSPPKFSTAVLKPADNAAGFGVKVSRRSGWEDVEWRFQYK